MSIPVSSAAIHLGLLRDPLTAMTDATRRHGDVVQHRIGRTRLVQVTHPDDLHTVLHARFPVVKKSRVVRGLTDIVGDGLLTAHGDRYSALRKPAVRLFTPKHIDAWAQTMARVAEQTAREWASDPGRVDVLPRLTHATLRILVQTVFGTSCRSDDPTLVGALEALDGLVEDFEQQTYTAWRLVPDALRPGRRRRIAAMRAALTAGVDGLVARRRQQTPGEDEPDDLLGRLLALDLAPDTLRAHLLTLFVAGHETTALTLAFALHHLAENPDAAERICEEAADGAPTRLADLERFPYTRAVIRETLRLTPAVFGMGREIVRPLPLRDHVLEPGMQVVTPQWVVHRDPRWWENPNGWWPERFFEERARPRYAYFPFGGGPRVCIGNHFAMLEATILLAHIVPAIQVADAAPLKPRPTLTLRPADGVKMTCTSRPSRVFRRTA